MSAIAVCRSHDRNQVHGSFRAAMVAAGRRWSTGQRELVKLAAELDASGEWALDGARTCAHWIADALDVEVCTAREWLRIGHALAGLSVTDEAFAGGQLSYSKVRALTRVADAGNEAELCELARRVPAGRLAHALAAWVMRHEHPSDTESRHQDARSFTWRLDCHGMVTGTVRLPPREAAIVTAAVDSAALRHRPRPTERDRTDLAERGAHAPADACLPRGVATWPSVAQQRADALVEIVSGGGAHVATEIVLHVRGDGCTLDDGTPIAESVVARVAPSSFIRTLIHDAQSRPLNASSRQRHPSARQRRVVRERDRACVDCGATELLEYDHEPAYELTGHTVVDELRLRCWTCHRARHRDEARSALPSRS